MKGNNFLGLDYKLSSYDSAKVAILPVPYEATVSFGRGTSNGPAAIIKASEQVELYDEELGCEPCDVGITTLDAPDLSGIAPSDLKHILAPHVSKILSDNKLPIILGGEHSITPAAFDAVYKVHPDITVLQLDAHADLRQEYEGESMSHACAMARVRDLAPAVQVGIRNLSDAEAKWVRRDKLPVFYAKDIYDNDRWMKDAIDKIKTDKVYVTIDVDVFDSSVMPATGTPEPGGLTWYDVTKFLRLLMNKKRAVGFDLVELAPTPNLHACDFLVAKLAYKCIGYWRERHMT
ncbi:MAG: agmatinase [Pseudomonadota bacterium]